MEKAGQPSGTARADLVQKTPVLSGRGPKLERKYVEKNRRNQLKGLYNQLFSLVPSSQETLPLPDQVDVTINYIKTMKEKLEKMKHEREELMMMKKKAQSRKMHSCASSLSSHLHHHVEPHPQIHIHEMGPAMAVVFITGLDNVATFNDIIRVVRGEEGVEVTSASFQLHGNSTLQIVGEPVGKWAVSNGAAGAITSVSKKLKEMISGATSTETESSSRLELWDYDIENEVWGFDVVAPLQHNIEQY
ncbi:transcription factor bHLH162-like [Ipomoea triloba]|uniref:transcription factor bHLH162-like n=1 Tax=Ipomoea triloba TaxID=35885 RepID=UPI00125D5178|nr:transcription factor bHLH162-like [Ipomoea triloba]